MKELRLNEMIRSAQEAIASNDVREAAKTLATYNLGICIPHMHDLETGEIVGLPSGWMSRERNLRVSFDKITPTSDSSMVPVAWRWDGIDMEVCSSCCSAGPE